MRKFIIRLVMFLPLLIFVIGINLYIDPANLFRHDYEKGIAEIMYSGKNVENIGDYDERLTQKHYIDLLTSSKDTIVLGSSRSMGINSKVLENNNMFNNSVSGGSLEDYMAIYGMYKEKNILPKKIIIGIDPWVFNRNSGQDRWKSISSYYYLVDNAIGYESPNTSIVNNKYFELISLKYFQVSIRNLFKGNTKYNATTKEETENSIKLNDGSLVYDIKTRNKSVSDVDKETASFISGEVYSLGRFKEMDKIYVDKFIKFIDLLKADRVEITFFFPPYHPIVYDYLIGSDEYSIISELERYLTGFAEKNNIPVIGSYNPANDEQGYVLSNECFYDGMHPKNEAIYIMFEDHENIR